MKASKTDPYGATCVIPVAATGTDTYPVRAMRKFLTCTQFPSPWPLFTLTLGDFLTRPFLTIRTLRQATGQPLQQPQPPNMGCHSHCSSRTPLVANQGHGPLEKCHLPALHLFPVEGAPGSRTSSGSTGSAMT